VISTPVGIAPELIRHGVNGLLSERTVASIRASIIRLRDDRDLRAAMGEDARRTVLTSWRWEQQARHYVPFFDHGLRAAQQPRDSGKMGGLQPFGSL